jgi:hypothetical protein
VTSITDALTSTMSVFGCLSAMRPRSSPIIRGRAVDTGATFWESWGGVWGEPGQPDPPCRRYGDGRPTDANAGGRSPPRARRRRRAAWALSTDRAAA